MRFPYFALVYGLCLSVIPMTARADNFTITGTNTITFSLPASPTPVSSTKGEGFILDNVAVTLNGTQMNEDILFFEDGIIIGQNPSIVKDGIFYDFNATNEIANDFSYVPDAQSFDGQTSGPLYTPNGESAPTFLTGTLSGTIKSGMAIQA